jgi:hypothetical protein
MRTILWILNSLLFLAAALAAASAIPFAPSPGASAEALGGARTVPNPVALSGPEPLVSPPLAAVPMLPAALPPAAGPRRFAVKVKDVVSPHSVMGVFALPAENLLLETVPTETFSTATDPLNFPAYVLESTAGELTQVGANRWSWNAPREPGLYPMRILDAATQESTLLNVFVMLPHSQVKDGHLNRYRIGRYPAKRLNDNPVYDPPRGFVEVTSENEETLIAPHFKLKQFLCKQTPEYPKYVVIDERLLMTLETVVEKLQNAGYEANTLHVMSGYRTPYYNQAIGNVQYSCHQWGVAADVFVDHDGDEVMDDLNRDGRIDRGDAGVLYDLIDGISNDASHSHSVSGGLARYGATASHGPFVHVDVRGVRARWDG